ncbi:hypothetical protein BHM03_00029025 [Ensete ventricosum]|nr:hypothetical protein BHM03_00029025 [Ensete ventricosum]
MGTGVLPFTPDQCAKMKLAILHAIELGYRQALPIRGSSRGSLMALVTESNPEKMSIPEVALSSSSTTTRAMPVLGMGTGGYPFTVDGKKKLAIRHAIELGYRHFDTASLYQFEPALGEAIAEALHLGLIDSRSDLFITSKLWCTDAHPDLVLPAIRETLRWNDS